jgi:hypothetical protein
VKEQLQNPSVLTEEKGIELRGNVLPDAHCQEFQHQAEEGLFESSI